MNQARVLGRPVEPRVLQELQRRALPGPDMVEEPAGSYGPSEPAQLTLVPAYGRDYRSRAAVLADWRAGKDFIIYDARSRWDGKPTNIEDCRHMGVAEVRIRFDAKRKLVIAPVGG